MRRSLRLSFFVPILMVAAFVVSAAPAAAASPPNPITAPDPTDGATSVETTSLGWQGGVDPDGGAVTFDVLLGTDPGSLTVTCDDIADYSCDVTLAEVTTYYWQVVATDADSEQTSSPVWSFTTALARPTDFAATTISQTQIDLNWDDSSAIEEGFWIRRSTDLHFGDEDPYWSVPAETESYADTGVLCGTTYYYRIKAFQGAMLSGHGSATATTLDCDPLPSPANFAGTAISHTAIELTWDDVDGETGYRLERSTDGATWIALDPEPAQNAESYSDSGLTCGTEYSYRLTAYRDQTPTEAAPVETSVDTVACPPAAPSDLVATPAGQTQIDLTWTDNSDETEFRIERSPNGTTGWVLAGTNPAGDTTFSDTGLTCETPYFYRVFAYRAGDNQTSGPSTVADAATTACPPAAPTDLTATAVGQTQIDLTWTDNSDETEFRVERSPDGVSDWVEIAIVAADGTSYSDIDLICGDTYHYRVRGYHSGDGLFSGYSNIAETTTDICPIGPTVKKPADGAFGTKLPQFKWNKVPDAVGYEIQLADNELFTGADSALTTATKYTFVAPAYGVYYWRVRADLGEGVWTDWSEVRSYVVTLHTSPKNGSITTDTTPTFKWKKTSKALAVEFQLNADPVVELPGGASQYTPSIPLAYGGYTWQMRVQYSDASWSPWMPAWTVTVVPPTPARPQLDLPKNKAKLTIATPTFSWLPVDFGDTYEIQIDDNKGFGSPVVVPPLAGQEYTPVDPLPDGTYYWRVRAINSAGIAGGWSGSRKVIVDAAP